MASFFEHQDRAQSKTGWLVFLFLMGTLGITGCVTAIVAWAIPDAIPLAIGVSLAMVGIPFLYKLVTLNSGGEPVALAMGGVRIDPATTDPAQRRILNVVEEMAIASGMPIPPVFLMHEPSINAFAAGTTPQNAVIGISRGAIDSLTRDELQGVMAHEFSHIFHGDMRINMRAIAAIFGLMAIGYVGYTLFRMQAYGRVSKSDRKAAGGILLFGLALMIIGAIGTFFGRLMQAAISRQREFLADASAVQYTRNPEGIGSALLKISQQDSSTIHCAQASQFNHMLFSEGVNTLFASHPPLIERINRIKAMAGGVFAPRPARVPNNPMDRPVNLSASFSGAGTIAPEALQFAHDVSTGAVSGLIEQAHTVEGAQALVYWLSLAVNPSLAQQQAKFLEQSNAPGVGGLKALMGQSTRHSVQQRLACLDVACATLVNSDPANYRAFREALAGSLKVDGSINLFEWVVTQILRMRVEEPMALAGSRRPPDRNANLEQLSGPAQRILAILALQGAKDDSSALVALACGLDAAGLDSVDLPPASQRTLDAVAEDLNQIERLRPAAAGRFLRGALECVSHDRVTSDSEYLLLRAVSERLQVPLPLQYG